MAEPFDTLAGLAGRAARQAVDLAEDTTLGLLDATLGSRFAVRVVEHAAASRLIEAAGRELARYQVIERVGEQLITRELVDDVVARVLESEELWLVVDEVARSPAVTDAITQQSMGFADQVAGVVRGRSLRADDRLERVARRLLRRSPNGSAASAPVEP